MIEVRETGNFSEWLAGLRDVRAKAEVARQLRRLAFGNPATRSRLATASASFVSIMALATGSMTCSYVQRGSVLIILLCGGDKSGQAKDIAMARKLAKEI